MLGRCQRQVLTEFLAWHGPHPDGSLRTQVCHSKAAMDLCHQGAKRSHIHAFKPDDKDSRLKQCFTSMPWFSWICSPTASPTTLIFGIPATYRTLGIRNFKTPRLRLDLTLISDYLSISHRFSQLIPKRRECHGQKSGEALHISNFTPWDAPMSPNDIVQHLRRLLTLKAVTKYDKEMFAK